MPVSAKTVRNQIAKLKPLLRSCSLEASRKGHNHLGELMQARYHRQVLTKRHCFPHFDAAWVICKDERRQGVILYLHGGGYTCGDLDYAKGFATTLAVQCGARVFCPAYRLAPEAPFPAALNDALEAYRYLLKKGYDSSHITLCGESAGGGLCFALCLRLRDLGLPLPCGILAISPWTDLTASGTSYKENQDIDPTITQAQLNFYADCYADDRSNPLVSPLFADLQGMPPTLTFVGSEEIMLSDSEDMHKKLLEAGCESRLVVKPERWHGYLLFNLEEDQKDFEQIGRFLTQHMSPERKLRWMRLDNAAKIYPAASRQNWSSVFRVSATLTEDVDKAVLQAALDVTVRRFPSIAARLRRGAFWYYLQQLSYVPEIREESSYPLTRMSRKEICHCALRVIVYNRRIAVEVFHSLTDGSGAMVFLKTLLAEYLQQKHRIAIPAEKGVLGRLEAPSDEELEDSFQKYAGPISASRKENNAWRLNGTPELDGFYHLTCFSVPVSAALEKAHHYGVSLTAFLAAALLLALQNMQKLQVSNPKMRKSLKIQIPINLRNLFPSRTLRNFAMYTTPEIDPRLGEYTFEEICKIVHHHMGMDITPKRMAQRIAANVKAERLMAVKLMPLFLKNIVMKAAFDAVGEKKSCLSLSNLGMVQLPQVMMPYVQRMDFILGPQATMPHNCGALSFGDTLYINFIRNIQESTLEYHFHCVLRDLGLPLQIQSNRPEV